MSKSPVDGHDSITASASQTIEGKHPAKWQFRSQCPKNVFPATFERNAIGGKMSKFPIFMARPSMGGCNIIAGLGLAVPLENCRQHTQQQRHCHDRPPIKSHLYVATTKIKHSDSLLTLHQVNWGPNLYMFQERWLIKNLHPTHHGHMTTSA
jgi:hypothetical protein